MAIKDVESKCWILALFVRDDGERFLLGDGSYEFTEKQLHFAANTMANDVVEVQGNDGYLLAGQVRRPSTQTFDGYVGDSSTSKAVVEERRRAFFAFFRKNFFYKVIYIFPDGSAIQRKRGFLVDAPEVKEIRQIYPEYHVALNFEDINYYYYDEDADGQEIYGKSATINLNSVAQSGGLIWLLPSEMTLTGEGTSFTLSGTVNGTALTSAELKGNTYQQTYSGKNLLPITMTSQTINGITFTVNADKSITMSGTATARTEPKIYQSGTGVPSITLQAGTTYHNSMANTLLYLYTGSYRIISNNGNYTPSANETVQYAYIRVENGESVNTTIYPMLEQGSTATSYEPYTGGIPAPNPDYPQEVQTATGRQVVTISNGTESQEYEVNLGKNLWNPTPYKTGYVIAADGTDYPTSGGAQWEYKSVLPSTEYTFSITGGAQSGNMRIHAFNSDGTWIQQIDVVPIQSGVSVTKTIVTPANIGILRWSFFNDSTSNQLELGSATSYAPYFEPIELCKIGTYQDRIYKSGDDWYLRKETNKITMNNLYGGYGSGNVWYYWSLNNAGLPRGVASGAIMSPYFRGTTQSYMQNHKTEDGLCALAGETDIVIRILAFSTATEYQNWLSSVSPAFYYAMKTPTDTQITNTALIAQLNTLAAATTYNGTTNFTVDGNGNLAAILAVEVEAVGGGGVEWDENGAVWEEGKPSYSIISVDSIDNVYPVLTITGRTVNPVLTDVTTGTIFQYNGTITESQVLRVDMMNKTATLNGVSVIGNVTGDWLYLAPGNNRITYTADNADAPNATVEWQEIVG
ncbi:phage tail family protein [Candidatus Saccharibacteria bacterium]|nr:phage tail family protein [Candidatus Saccharibacteria bacterium]